MAPFYLILVLVIQSTLTYAETDLEDIDATENKENEVQDVLENDPEFDKEVIHDFREAKQDWMDMFMLPNNNLFPTSSIDMMAEATNCSNKTAEEQLEDIKDMAHKITLAIQNEMANLLTFALNACDKDIEDEVKEDNNLRKRRSVETPMDSTQLVMRLLKHIKANNEYQNIAIEKMMSAQEIADKFGIEFSPDPEVLSDLAFAANEHTQELSTILKDACNLKNITTEQLIFVPLSDEDNRPINTTANDNCTYYSYEVCNSDSDNVSQFGTLPLFEYAPQIVSKTQVPVNHVHYSDPYATHHHIRPYETQITSPPVQHYSTPTQHYTPSVTQRPNFYEPFPTYEYYPQYSIEPVIRTAAVILPIEEPEPEPELVGEELEEVISSKVFIERGNEPGSATLNHVTTYTVAEKSHFKTPQIEKLPQQMQYCFFML